MRNLLLSLLAMTVLLSGCSSDQAIREAVERQIDRYPQSALQDIYKSFYQDRFGPGHMIADTASFADYTRYELAVAATDSVPNPYYEPVGARGAYVRVYLRCVNEGLLTAEQLMDAFLRSTTPAGQPAQTWADEWRTVAQTAREAGITTTEDDNRLLMQAAENNQAVHHSDAYRNAYHPHYRIVRRDIFESELKPLIRPEE